MRKYIIGKCMKIVSNNKNLDKTTLEEIEYGLIAIYILITKLIIIFAIAFILGILKETFIFILIYSIIRAFSFGMHANKSWICLIISTIIMIGIPFISLHLNIPLYLKIILGIITTLLIFKNSPADTVKRPIINPKRRKIYKIISTFIAIIFTIISIFIDNNFISNCLIFSLIIQAIIISPLTYKLFKMPYNNYKKYLIQQI